MEASKTNEGVVLSGSSPPCGIPHRSLAASATRCGPGRWRAVLTGLPLRLLPSSRGNDSRRLGRPGLEMSAKVAGKAIEVAGQRFQRAKPRRIGQLGRDAGKRRQSFAQDLPCRLPVRQHEEGGPYDLEGRPGGSPWELRPNRK